MGYVEDLEDYMAPRGNGGRLVVAYGVYTED